MDGLTEQELRNLKACCVIVAKGSNTSEAEMAMLLQLSSKLEKLIQDKQKEPVLNQEEQPATLE